MLPSTFGSHGRARHDCKPEAIPGFVVLGFHEDFTNTVRHTTHAARRIGRECFSLVERPDCLYWGRFDLDDFDAAVTGPGQTCTILTTSIFLQWRSDNLGNTMGCVKSTWQARVIADMDRTLSDHCSPDKTWSESVKVALSKRAGLGNLQRPGTNALGSRTLATKIFVGASLVVRSVLGARTPCKQARSRQLDFDDPRRSA
jgi:hypothetical protein